MLVLEVPDDGLHGRSPTHLTLDGRRDAALLPGCDSELVAIRRIVAAIFRMRESSLPMVCSMSGMMVANA